MNGVAIARTTSDRFIGSCWYVDPEERMIRENLGKGAPPFHFGEVFETREAAAARCPGDYRVRPLPDRIRIPRGTPIALEAGRQLVNATTRVYLLRFGCLMAEGLRVESVPVASVEYIPAPFRLSGQVDFVASAVNVDSRTRLRIRIVHDTGGVPYIEEAPMAFQAWGWTPCTDTLAFLSAKDAQDYADRMADRLKAAADWRANSPSVT